MTLPSYFYCLTCLCFFFPSFRSQLAEVKVRILEAKQTLEDCISAQEFSQAAELKNSITDLENRRNQILQDIAESNQVADKEVRTEKVYNYTETSPLHLNVQFLLSSSSIRHRAVPRTGRAVLTC